MITAIFSRCLNLIWRYVFPACPTAKTGVHDAHPVLECGSILLQNNLLG